MADPNNLLLREHRLIVMLICKAANTSIKWAIANALGLPATHRTDLYYPCCTTVDASRFKSDGYLVIAAVRNPFTRLESCYRDKIAMKFHQPFARKYGNTFYNGQTFDSFARAVAKIPDNAADQHFRSMSWDLVCPYIGNPPTFAGYETIVPEFYRVEDPNWWEKIRERIRKHCGLDIGDERRNNVGRNNVNQYSDELRGIVAQRYEQDLRLFGYGA